MTARATPFITVAGTWGYDDAWYLPASPWSLLMNAHGFEPLHCDDPPRRFTWTTNVNGVKFWQRWTGGSDDRDWRTAGENLFAYLVPPVAPDRRVPAGDVNIVSHSHGLQCVLYAAALGLKINSLVDVAGPVRADMAVIARAARPNIRHWQHLHSDRTDHTQWLGEIGDGAFGIVREHPLADVNVLMAQAGHSGALNEPQYFGVWTDVLARVRAL